MCLHSLTCSFAQCSRKDLSSIYLTFNIYLACRFTRLTQTLTAGTKWLNPTAVNEKLSINFFEVFGCTLDLSHSYIIILSLALTPKDNKNTKEWSALGLLSPCISQSHVTVLVWSPDTSWLLLFPVGAGWPGPPWLSLITTCTHSPDWHTTPAPAQCTELGVQLATARLTPAQPDCLYTHCCTCSGTLEQQSS